MTTGSERESKVFMKGHLARLAEDRASRARDGEANLTAAAKQTSTWVHHRLRVGDAVMVQYTPRPCAPKGACGRCRQPKRHGRHGIGLCPLEP